MPAVKSHHGCELMAPEDINVDLLGLPPLLPPTHCSRSLSGALLVLTIIAVILGVSYAAALTVMDKPVTWLILGLVCLEASIALACLGGVLFGDPGVIARSPETCFPLPEPVAAMLRAGVHRVDGMAPISENGRSYCCRCCVWRGDSLGRAARRDEAALRDEDLEWEPEEGDTHHCPDCERCIEDVYLHCRAAASNLPHVAHVVLIWQV